VKILCVFGRYAYGDPARGEGYEHAHFLPALRRMGHEAELFESFDRSVWADFGDLNRNLLERVLAWGPDVVLCVLMGYEVWTETLDLIRRASRAIAINWSTDDSWKYAQFSRFVARHFDLYVTTCRAAFDRARRDGLSNVVLSQWAASAERLAEPLPAARCEYDVSFVGAAYGNRPRWVEALRRRGIAVECFGHGWPRGAVAAEEVPAIMRRSRISLNFADSGRVVSGVRVTHSRQIKARTFEVPGAGGCLFTEPADDLATYFEPDREIVIFRDPDGLAARIAEFLADPARRDRVAMAGHRRTREEHTYERRFADLFERVSALRAARGVPALSHARAVAAMGALVESHALRAPHRALRRALVTPFAWTWGERRGARAARRAWFELSWRIAGARTYSARGLAGRLFYRES
jgi:spore maturation protein CgeB